MDIKKTNFSDWENKEPDEDARRKIKESFLDYFKKTMGKIPFTEDIVSLYLLFGDPEYPLMKKGICVFALLYFITPLDIVPDVIPMVGFLDDAGVVAAAIKLYANDMMPYREKARQWLEDNGFI